MKDGFFNRIFRGDKGIWFIFMFLCMISIVEVFSATSQLSYRSGAFWSPITSHCIYLLFGFFVVLVVHYLPYRWWKLLGILMLALSAVLLVYVMVAGEKVNGASRWISIAGFQFQPSEMAKAAVIIVTSWLLSRLTGDRYDDRCLTLWIAGIALAICGLIALDNLSTAGILGIVVVIMMLIGGAPKRYLLPVIGIGAAGVVLVLTFFLATPRSTMAKIQETVHVHRLVTWQRRVKEFIVVLPDNPKDYRITDDNRQISHALIAVSSSGIVGCGPGNSVQRDFLSQAYSDFIFAIVIEELGLAGSIVVMFLYIALLIRAGRIAGRCRQRFPALLAMGCALMLVTQAFINMLISVNLFPVTGQPLPLISRGGTSIAFSCLYIAILLNISASTEPDYGVAAEAKNEKSHLTISNYERDEAELI